MALTLDLALQEMSGLRIIFFLLAPVLWVACSSTGQDRVPEKPAAEIFFKNPERTQYQIAPDGSSISFLAPWNRVLNLYLQHTESNEAVRITSDSLWGIRWYCWVGPASIGYVKSSTDRKFSRFMLYDVRSGKHTDVTPFDSVQVHLIDALRSDSNAILLGINRNNPRVFDAYRYNIGTGALSLAASNPGDIIKWLPDHRGRIRLALRSDGVNEALLYRNKESEPFRTTLQTPFTEHFKPLLFDFENRYVFALSSIGREFMALVLLDAATGQEVEVIAEAENADIDRVGYSPAEQKLTYYSYSNPKRVYMPLDSSMARFMRSINREVEGSELEMVDHTRDEKTWIVRTREDLSRGEYYLFDDHKGVLRHLASASPWIKREAMSPMEYLTYTTRDGIILHGFLTRPAGYTKKPLPLIVYPHAGPWSRDTWCFDPVAQFWASRGYAVFQPNFRGSTGYGKSFWQSGFKEWGGKIQDDITDGVLFLARNGVVDSGRVAVFGYDFGGYSGLMCLANYPNLYKCAVSYSGYVNLFSYLRELPITWEPYREMLFAMVGHPELDRELLTNHSPAFQVARISGPVMIIQGASDPLVSPRESMELIRTLKKNGIPAEYLEIPGEGHSFRKEENLLRLYTRADSFISLYLGPELGL